ncbi:MAG: hypothetical protein ABI760_20755, partial [Ferruginibacter sp.]
MICKLITFTFLMFSYSSTVKHEPTHQPPIESPLSPLEPMPEGNTGIASRYPGDVGIGSDPAVLFADDFESYTTVADLTGRWNEAYHTANFRIASEPGNVFHGARSLEFTVPKTNTEISNTVVKYIIPERDTLFLRYYGKFDSSFNVIGSSHNGSTVSSSYYSGEGSGPGIKADGYNKFMISYEVGRWEEEDIANPGKLNIYIY